VKEFAGPPGVSVVSVVSEDTMVEVDSEDTIVEVEDIMVEVEDIMEEEDMVEDIMQVVVMEEVIMEVMEEVIMEVTVQGTMVDNMVVIMQEVALMGQQVTTVEPMDSKEVVEELNNMQVVIKVEAHLAIMEPLCMLPLVTLIM